MNPLSIVDTLLAIAHVAVIPMDREVVLRDQTVLLGGGRIAVVAPASSVVIPAGTRIIDGRGLTLLPGLADMHVHVTPGDFPALLMNGITTARELNGSPDHLRWRSEVDTGARIGPRLIVSSPLLAGIPQRWRHVLVTSDTAARRVIHEVARAGYDLVKTYDGLTPEVYSSIVAEARRLGLRVTGHVPRAVGLAGVVSARPGSIEHAQMILEAVGGHDADRVAAERAVDLLAGSGIWIVPTLAAYEALNLMRTRAMQERFQRPEMAYVDSALRAWWMTFRDDSSRTATPGQRRRVMMSRLLVARAMASGIEILAGTDTPNPLMVPGFSLHDELAALEGAGLSRYQVLASATVKAAEYMGWEKEAGTVTPGKRADLVLVRGNPLDDLGALRALDALVLRGRYFSRSDLLAIMPHR
jgi:imidazolonepropionase-like amidohydrolase